MSRIIEQAQAQRDEAKRLLGQFIVDQGVADRIVDCIIGAGMLEITAMMCAPAAQSGKEQPGGGA